MSATNFSSNDIKKRYIEFVGKRDRVLKTLNFIENSNLNISNILSIGSGYSHLENSLLKLGANSITAIDKQESMIEYAKMYNAGPDYYTGDIVEISNDFFERNMELPEYLTKRLKTTNLIILSFVILNIDSKNELSAIFRLLSYILSNSRQANIVLTTIDKETIYNHETENYKVEIPQDNTESHKLIYGIEYKKPINMTFKNVYWDEIYLEKLLREYDIKTTLSKKIKLDDGIVMKLITLRKAIT